MTAGTKCPGKMNKLHCDGAAVTPAGRDAAASGDQSFPKLLRAEPLEKPVNFCVVKEPVEAEFHGVREAERSLELGPKRLSGSASRNRAQFVIEPHRISGHPA